MRIIETALFTVLLAVPATASAEPADGERTAVNNWADLRAALTRCWLIPDDTDGSVVALRFGIDKNGAIRGTPLVTATRLSGDKAARDRYRDAVFAALDRCFPLNVTPSFGAILGESPMRLRFMNTQPEAAFQLNSNMTLFAPPRPR